jgi:hypothetical protein
LYEYRWKYQLCVGEEKSTFNTEGIALYGLLFPQYQFLKDHLEKYTDFCEELANFETARK